MVFCAALELRRASGVLPAGAGGNRPGIPACRPGSRLSKSGYRAAEVASGCFLSRGCGVKSPQMSYGRQFANYV